MADESGTGPETTEEKNRRAAYARDYGMGKAWDATLPPVAAPAAAPAPTPGWFRWPATNQDQMGNPTVSPPAFTFPATAPAATPIERPPPQDPTDFMPDFRDPGQLTGVPVGGSVAQAAAPGRYGVIPPALANGAVAAVTSLAPPAPVAVEEKPPPPAAPSAAAPATAGDIAGPEAVAARFKRVEALNAEQKRLEEERRATLEPARKAREQFLANTRRELAQYREGLEAARPPQPKLEKMPGVPDMKVRPWLDPEGKDAISVIAQTLGMLAVGAAGVHYKTPLTAMRYFREAAENWRRDEVDAASSKFKQFQATVETIKNDNDVELQQYALADKAYAHNVEAKKAMVAARLDDLGLQDQAIKALEQPYDDRVKAVQAQTKDILALQKASTDYLEAAAKLTKGAAKLPATELGLGGFIAEGKRRLADPADPVATDPAARKTLEGQVQTAQENLKDYRQNKITTAETKAGNQATIQIGKTRLMDGVKLQQSADYFEKQLDKLFEDYKTAAAFPGALPASNTLTDKWWSELQRNWTAFPPNVQGALANIRTFKNELQVGMGRAFLNDRGVNSIKAFGELGTSIMSFPEARGVLRRWTGMVADARHNADRMIREGGSILETPGASAVPTPEPQPEPEPE